MLLGVLTATFIPPWSCQHALSSTSWNGKIYNVGPASTTNCFPTNYHYDRDDYYSASMCPLGYNTACSSTATVSGSDDEIETVVTCCPAPLTCNTATDDDVAATMGCHSVWTERNTISSLLIISGNVPKATTSAAANSGTLNAFSVQIRFQATDSPSSSSVATPGTGVPFTTPTTTAPATTSTASGGSGLGTSAIVGISVGCAAGGILIAGLIGFWCLRRQRSVQHPPGRLDTAEEGPGAGAQPTQPSVEELCGSKASTSDLSTPTPGAQIDETMFKYLPSDQIPGPRPQELYAHDFSSEMEGAALLELPVPPSHRDYPMERR